MAKLTFAAAEVIRRRYNEAKRGEKTKIGELLAAEYGVCLGTVQSVAYGNYWVPGTGGV